MRGSRIDQYRDVFALEGDGGALDLSYFKQTGQHHAATAPNGGNTAPTLGDAMLEVAALLGFDRSLDAGRSDFVTSHGNAKSDHGASDLVDHSPQHAKPTGAGGGGKGAGKGKGGSSNDGSGGGGSGEGTGTGGTGGTLDTSSPAPQYAIDALLSGYSWGSGPLTIKYSFLDALPTYYGATAAEANNFSIFTTVQETAARAVLDMLSGMVNVTFVETADAYAQITFGNASLGSGIGAWAYYPYSPSAANSAGDIWINSDYGHNFSPTPGNFAYLTLIHELGHAMGLKHPFEGPTTLTGIENSRQYTVESYAVHTSMGGVEPQTYMPYDIAALQSLYGANTMTGAGDSVYSFSAASNLIKTIWDAGGVDTLDVSAMTSSVFVDMQGGHFSSIGGQSNVAIAHNVTIENAVGGDGNDTIIGNYAANTISGGGGSDILTSGGGNDHFVFGRGHGSDTITDFADGTDILDLRSMGVSMANVNVADGSVGAVINVADTTITLTAVAANLIDSSDFLFT